MIMILIHSKQKRKNGKNIIHNKMYINPEYQKNDDIPTYDDLVLKLYEVPVLQLYEEPVLRLYESIY